jgi:SWI/SNF-related matrix-associated actin-dependent regulator 1 of chromatin subfamily A
MIIAGVIIKGYPLFYLKGDTFDIKEELKNRKFKWDPEKKLWYTSDEKSFNEVLLKYKDRILYDQKSFDSYYNYIKDNKTLSRSKELQEDIEVPLPPNYKLYPFQKVGVKFLATHKYALLADEMGLGKTIMAYSTINYLLINKNIINNILIICPKTAKGVWEYEKRWLIKLPNIDIYNYDILGKVMDEINRKRYDIIIFDEAHYLKNSKALRTKHAREIIKVQTTLNNNIYIWLLTGTPLMNRLKELYNLLRLIKHPITNNYTEFINKYLILNPYGAEVGHKNLGELEEILRSTVMLRRQKKDVLPELPDKIIQVLILGSLNKEEAERELSLFNKWEEIQDKIKTTMDPNILRSLSYERDMVFEEISRIRHDDAVKKLPYVIDYIEDVLENKDKVVIFAHHHDVINTIYDHFKDISVKYTGEENEVLRKKAIEEFNSNPNIKLFIGSLRVASMSITLTAADTAIFAEIDWNVSINEQAEDRLLRIGQKNSVNIIYTILDNSIDKLILKKNFEKKEMIVSVLGDKYNNHINNQGGGK